MKLGVITPYETLTPSPSKVSDTLYNLMIGRNSTWESPNKVIGFGSEEFRKCVKQFSDLIIFCKYENADLEFSLKLGINSPKLSRVESQRDNSPRSPQGSPRIDSPRRDSPRGSPRLNNRKISPRKNIVLEKILDTCTHVVVFCKTGVEPETLMALRRIAGETMVYKVDGWIS